MVSTRHVPMKSLAKGKGDVSWDEGMIPFHLMMANQEHSFAFCCLLEQMHFQVALGGQPRSRLRIVSGLLMSLERRSLAHGIKRGYVM